MSKKRLINNFRPNKLYELILVKIFEFKNTESIELFFPTHITGVGLYHTYMCLIYYIIL